LVSALPIQSAFEQAGVVFPTIACGGTWEIFRLRRLKKSLLDAAMVGALTQTLAPLFYEPPPKTEDQTGFPQLLQFDVTPGPPRAEYELAKKWAKRDPAAIYRVNKLMASANLTMDAVIKIAFMENFDTIERIDHVEAILEKRRNAVLNEIDRRRLAQVRESIRAVEEAEWEQVSPRKVTARNETNKNGHD
jgi:hypothetical protein